LVGHVYSLVPLAMADHWLARQMPRRCCNTYCRCRSRHIFGDAKEFYPNFSKLARKIYKNDLQKTSSYDSGCHFSQIKAHQHQTPFLMVYSRTSIENVFIYFWAPFSSNKAHQAPFLHVFSGILRKFSHILPRFPRTLPGFSSNQNSRGCACTPCTPASYTTVVICFPIIARQS